jgi:regulator of protease activity HflC (stomatin/prohibitin superfamily)
MIKESARRGAPGLPTLLLLLALMGLSVLWVVRAARDGNTTGIVGALILFTLIIVAFAGLTIVNPNEARVMVLFGRYAGTIRADGFYWVNPFMVKKKVSLRVRNFETSKLKVNDSHSNPIEIAAVVVWRVVDTAEALFEVDDYEDFVAVQSEAALRNLASRHPYDGHDDELSLRGNTPQVCDQLQHDIQERLVKAGVEVLEARISHLAYAPEIAAAMLQRQQASAIIAARYKIVEGAVGMVENALEMLSARNVIHLDEDKKATMVSNLLVVLCSERGSTPVINAGSIY